MASSPREYLTLVNTGPDQNFSQYTASGAAPGTNVRTRYGRLRVDPVRLSVDVHDQTFTTSTGSLTHGSAAVASMPYGVAASCDQAPSGLANIDLRGTPFAVASPFCQSGWRPSGTVSQAHGDQVLDLTGGGYCGVARPAPCGGGFDPASSNTCDLRYIGGGEQRLRRGG